MTTDVTAGTPTGVPASCRPRGLRRHRRLQGLRAAAPVHRVRPRRHRRPDGGRAASSSAPPPGRRCPASRSRPRSGTTSTRCRTSASARPPTSSWSPRRRPTCWPRRRTGWPTTCSPTPCSPRGARSCSPRRCTPRCGSTPPPRANVATLRERGALVIEPAEGRLTGADTGKGRLPEPARDLRGLPRGARRAAWPRPTWPAARSWSRAGGTREYLDPVRFLGNRSSGPAGLRPGRTAAARGAEVTLVAANVSLPDPAGVKVVRVETTAELRDAVVGAAAGADAVVMAAAPADFRPVAVSEDQDQEGRRRQRAGPRAHPEPRHPRTSCRTDRVRPGAVIVGFAAETGDDTGSVLDLGRAKLARKGCDLLVVNDVSGGAVFGGARQRGRDPGRRRRGGRRTSRLQGSPGPRHLGPGRAPGSPLRRHVLRCWTPVIAADQRPADTGVSTPWPDASSPPSR